MKPLVIYHADCADGFGAAFAAWLKLGDDAEYVSMQYGKLDMECIDASVKERDVYILDFSLPKEVMDALFVNAKRVVWLDHHKTAFEMWIGGKFDGTEGDHHQEDQVRYITLSQSKSGAYLAWEYFHPGTEVPMLIKHIDDYDRWVFALEGTKAFNAALRSYEPWSFEQWRVLYRETHVPNGGSTSYLTDFLNQGEAILRAHDQNVQSVVKGAAMPCKIVYVRKLGADDDGFLWSGLAANCPPHLTSDVGHELATQSGTFGLCWYLNKEGKVKGSLRSNGDYDVSAIAKAFGGGGHRNAAGFETDIHTLMGWLK